MSASTKPVNSAVRATRKRARIPRKAPATPRRARPPRKPKDGRARLAVGRWGVSFALSPHRPTSPSPHRITYLPAVPRKILHADCDAYFVQVARLEDPEGAGREELLLVGGSSR